MAITIDVSSTNIKKEGTVITIPTLSNSKSGTTISSVASLGIAKSGTVIAGITVPVNVK